MLGVNAGEYRRGNTMNSITENTLTRSLKIALIVGAGLLFAAGAFAGVMLARYHYNAIIQTNQATYASQLKAISDEASEASDEDSGDEDMDDPIAVERRRRSKKQDQLRRTAGEPVKPEVTEILKLADPFGAMLRHVLAD